MSAPAPRPDARELLEKASVELRRLQAQNKALREAAREPIAVIGAGCRFPGGSRGMDRFWTLLRDGRDAVTGIPEGRWAAAALGAARGARWGAFTEGDPYLFEPSFFGMSQREADRLDPQQRWLLEVTWRALEDAGRAPDRLAGTRTGVFIGISHLDHEDLIKSQDLGELDAWAATGNLYATAAGRLCHTWDLRGPCVAIDTACSSSLVAIHQAMAALRDGACDLAIAGGVQAMLSPVGMQLVAATFGLAPDGRCKSFDARADGFVRGEGCGVLVLARERDARSNQDRIRGLLVGSAVNHDGHAAGLTVPNASAQAALVREALSRAGVAPSEVDLIEAHGTGTPLGDPIEMEALSAVIGAPRADGSTCAVGSVKTQVGHLEAAAGVAGLCKVLLAMEHEAIPGNLHFHALNPRISISGTPLRVAGAAQAWPRGLRRRVAGVSSFGIGGTNAHVVVAEPPHEARPPATPGPWPLWLSAPDAERLTERRDRVAGWLRGEGSSIAANDLSWTSAVRRSAHAWRLAVVGASAAELADALVASAIPPHPAPLRRVVFVFAGQGAQHPEMVRGLLSDPAFVETIAACDAGFESIGLPAVGPALRQGVPDGAPIDVVQPALFVVQVALARWWRERGVHPDAVIGHSMGEVAAACVSGLLSLQEGARVIGTRSRLMRTLSGRGAMALVELDGAAAAAWITRHPGAAIAALNGPRSTIVSGSVDAVDALVAALSSEGVFARRVKVDVASHCAQVDPILAELADSLAGLAGRPPQLRMRSTVLGRDLDAGDVGPAYWVDNLRQPVRLAEAVAALDAEDVVFFEIGPHPVVTPAIADTIRSTGRALAAMRRDEADELAVMRAASALWSAGAPIDPSRLIPGPRPPVPLPGDRFRRIRCAISATDPLRGDRTAADLIAAPDTDDGHGGVIRRANLSLKASPWLTDHLVGGRPAWPGVAWAVWAGAIRGRRDVRDLEVHALLTFEEDRPVPVTLAWHGDAGPRFTFRSRRSPHEPSVVHATGRLGDVETPELSLVTGAPVRSPGEVDADGHAARMSTQGVAYGPAFRGIVRVSASLAGVRAEVHASDGVAGAPEIDAARLDLAMQAAIWLLGPGAPAMLPVGIQRLTWTPIPQRFTVIARATARGPDRLRADLALLSEDGACVGRFTGLTLRAAPIAGAEAAPRLTVTEIACPPWASATTGLRPLVIGDAPWIEALCAAAPYTRRCADLHELAAILKSDPPSQVLIPINPAESGEHTPAVRLSGAARALVAAALRDPPSLVAVTAWDESGPDPDGHAAWGFMRCLAYEHPELSPRCLALHPQTDARALADALGDRAEPQLRIDAAGVGWAPRLMREGPPPESAEHPAMGRDFRLVQPRVGRLDTLRREATCVPDPGPGEVVVRVSRAALNFLDVLTAVGAMRGEGVDPPLGRECVGTVDAVGPGVTSFASGDRVIALAEGAFATRVVADARRVVRCPPSVDDDAASTLALPYLTAHAALIDDARLGPGETVLIHGGAGGVGLAAVHVALSVGARVIATAGDDERRNWLRSQGVTAVASSRDASFVDVVREATGGRGADVVLNSLAGALLDASLEALRDGGRFVEIGKRDYEADRPLPMGVFLRRIRWSLVDLRGVSRDDPEAIGALLRIVIERVERGLYPPLPVATAPASAASQQFDRMARGGHRGRLALAWGDPSTPVHPRGAWRGSADGRWIITGGLGGLGLAFARGLASRGVRALALLGRSPPGAQAASALEDLRDAGVDVAIVQVDVSDREALAGALARLRAAGPPLRGVIHAAVALEDGLIATSPDARVWRSWASKVYGGANLDELTAGDPISAFVVCGSVACVVGNPGQAGYGAASAWLEALVRRRRFAGRPGVCIAWGPWAEVGLAAGPRLASQLDAAGAAGLSTDLGVRALFEALEQDDPAPMISRFDARRWQETHLAVAGHPLFAALADSGPARTGGFADRVREMPEDERSATLLEHVRVQVAGVLRADPARVAADTPLKASGLDSLMAMELRNRLEASLGVALPVTVVFQHPTVGALRDHLASLIRPVSTSKSEPAQLPAPSSPPPASAAPDAGRLARLLRAAKGAAAAGDAGP